MKQDGQQAARSGNRRCWCRTVASPVTARGTRVYECRFTYVVPMAQPKRGVIRWLLGRKPTTLTTAYTRDREGEPDPGRTTCPPTNMAEFMGVDVVHEAVQRTGGGDAGRRVPGAVGPPWHGVGRVSTAAPRSTEGRTTAFRCSESTLGRQGSRSAVLTETRDGRVRAGDFRPRGPTWIHGRARSRVAGETGVDVPCPWIPTQPRLQLGRSRRQRIGDVPALLRRQHGRGLDAVATGGLRLSSTPPCDGRPTSGADEPAPRTSMSSSFRPIRHPDDDWVSSAPVSGAGSGPIPRPIPPEYRSGFGDERESGMLCEAFVEDGRHPGHVCTGRGPPDPGVRPARPQRASRALSSTEFWSPGSTLKVQASTATSLVRATECRTEALAAYPGQQPGVRGGAGTPGTHDVTSVSSTFVDRDILQSGWLLGEDAYREPGSDGIAIETRGRNGPS